MSFNVGIIAGTVTSVLVIGVVVAIVVFTCRRSVSFGVLKFSKHNYNPGIYDTVL